MSICSASQIVILLLFEKYTIVLVYPLYNPWVFITFLLVFTNIVESTWEVRIAYGNLETHNFQKILSFISAFSLILISMYCLEDQLLWLCLQLEVTWEMNCYSTLWQFNLISLSVSMLSFLSELQQHLCAKYSRR